MLRADRRKGNFWTMEQFEEGMQLVFEEISSFKQIYSFYGNILNWYFHKISEMKLDFN